MAPERNDNPLGLGPRDRESSNTGSVEDTSYDAVNSDPYTTGEPRKDPREPGTPADAASDPSRERSRPADPDTTSSDEP